MIYGLERVYIRNRWSFMAHAFNRQEEADEWLATSFDGEIKEIVTLDELIAVCGEGAVKRAIFEV